ncbi:uncharacterized protein B0H64DRAFT_108898 [Chaetomium fimeti]|uniref:Uncharacterized protein n=1 Tax=Chaetomium fimeti TaxID=1854472 RepID=A0AAE0LTJ3_9PEZI|nr:hypothetical protein B0H64DRAFT_108898 [Chaetomium fimeti]
MWMGGGTKARGSGTFPLICRRSCIQPRILALGPFSIFCIPAGIPIAMPRPSHSNLGARLIMEGGRETIEQSLTEPTFQAFEHRQGLPHTKRPRPEKFNHSNPFLPGEPAPSFMFLASTPCLTCLIEKPGTVLSPRCPSYCPRLSFLSPTS